PPRRHATLDEIGPSTGTVSLRREEFLLRAYALHRRGLPALRRSLETQGGYLLHVDGTETAGSPVVFVAWDEWSGLVLDARVLDTENADEIGAFFRDLEAALGRPQGLVSDMGTGILKAVRQVWPSLPLQLCHFHYVRDVGKDLFEKLEGEVRRQLLGTRVLARLGELAPGKPGDWVGSGARCAQELERLLSEAEPRWVRILQDHVLGPRERASRFPFELTYGRIAQHAWAVGPLAHELAMWNVGRNVLLRSLVAADRLLGKLAQDGAFTRLAYRVKTLTAAFSEYREALGVGRDVTGSDGEAASVAAAEGGRRVEAVLARWEGVAEGIDDEEVRQGVRQMREAWEKRKGNLFVEVRDLRGRLRTIERTNWRSEQGHREVRLAIRGGRGRVGRRRR
ncbi:MULE transposase, conserved domain protein, partial [mine drainage metagenome]